MLGEIARERNRIVAVGARASAVSTSLPALAVLASAAAAFVWFMHEELIKLDGLRAPGWDLGFDQQVVWNIANGHNFYSSFAHSNFLGDHFELILVVPALVEKFWPDPRVLLILGYFGLAATAPAAYLMLRALLGGSTRSGVLAAAIAAPIPFWASTQQAARDDFHPENLALALAMLAVWAGLRRRPILMWVLAVAVLCCKEDQVYTVGVAGLLIAARATPPMRRHGRAMIAAAAAWLVVMIGLVQNVIRIATHSGITYAVVQGGGKLPAQSSYYYYWLLHTTPGQLGRALANPQGWAILLIVVAGMCCLPLLEPRWLALAIPPFAANLFSNHTPQMQLVQHYALLPMFPVIVAGALGAERLEHMVELAAAAMAALALPALVLGYMFGSLPPGRIADLRPYSSPDARAELARASAFIPAGAPVAADDGVTPWLADRTDIHGFPGQGDAHAYVVLDRDSYVPAGSWRTTHDSAVARLSTEGRKLLFDDGRLEVWSPVQG